MVIMPQSKVTRSTIKRFQEGHADAFKAIFDTYHAQVYAFSLKITKSTIEAEEVTQQVFIRLWEKRHLVDLDRPLAAYLYKITRNNAFNHLKKIAFQQQQTAELRMLSSSLLAEDDLSFAECQKLTNELVDSLPEKRQIIYKMHIEEGYSPSEIASLLGISQSTVKSQLAKATKAVRGFLLSYRSASTLALLLLF